MMGGDAGKEVNGIYLLLNRFESVVDMMNQSESVLFLITRFLRPVILALLGFSHRNFYAIDIMLPVSIFEDACDTQQQRISLAER